ncbi:MAG: DEAD/DEAH box helicase [Bacteroidetes bacterium]|nr:DEAD/DEAH box helicase [Bacteroidota bacterium]
MDSKSFEDFNFSDDLMEGLYTMGYDVPTPIQQLVIPEILQNKDVLACAQTGTGKTAAYLLPTLQRISELKIPHTSVLIIAPTRELAHQIDQSFQGLAYFTHASSIAIYGGNDGMSFEREKKALMEGTSVVIATPGRLLSHLRMGYVKFNLLDTLILDEADKMLDMGFSDDIVAITQFLPEKRQNLLFSATMPAKIRPLAKRMMKDPVEVNIAISKPAAGITQEAYVVHDAQKAKLLLSLLEGKDIASILIFASTKLVVKSLEKELQRANISCNAIHSDLTQERREEVLLKFRNRNVPVLIATDILSRGIDVENIGLVINYDVPGDAEDYVHRVGRTARAETTGRAVTLIGPKDQSRFAQIEELIETTVPKLELPAELGPGPEWNPLKKKSFGGGGGFKGGKRRFNNKPKRKA